MVPRGPREDWHSLEKHDPEMFKVMREERELEQESVELAQAYRRAPTDEQAAVKEKLLQTVTRHFEVRQQRRTIEIKRLEQELQRLRESIERRTKAQEAIVNDRVSKLLGIDEGF